MTDLILTDSDTASHLVIQGLLADAVQQNWRVISLEEHVADATLEADGLREVLGVALTMIQSLTEQSSSLRDELRRYTASRVGAES